MRCKVCQLFVDTYAVFSVPKAPKEPFYLPIKNTVGAALMGETLTLRQA